MCTGYAVVSSTADLYGATGGLPAPRSLLGTVRIHVTSQRGADTVFAGIAQSACWPAGHSCWPAGVAFSAVPARRAASRRTQALAP